MQYLIIDDSGTTRGFIKQIIKTIDADAVFTEASDGKSAIHEMTEQRFDFITVDLQMEGMGGEQFIKIMNKNPLLTKKTFIVISSSITPKLTQEYKDFKNIFFYDKGLLHRCYLATSGGKCLSKGTRKCLHDIVSSKMGK